MMPTNVPAGEVPGVPGRESGRIATYEHLWTPWRMRYITGEASERGCIFCNRRDADDDVAALILYRGSHAYVIMNLFPYNTGHVMIVPNVHAATLEEIDDAALVEMARLAPRVTTALRRVLRCDGFNLGLNLGSIAGAGVAEHLHQHVVPRWTGDANFMPILASTMVMPELIPATYAKVRAELERDLHNADKVSVVMLADEGQNVLLRDGRVPVAHAGEGLPLWRSAIDLAIECSDEADIVGWSGCVRSGDSAAKETPAIAIRIGSAHLGRDGTIVPVRRLLEHTGDEEVARLMRSALRTLGLTSNTVPQ